MEEKKVKESVVMKKTEGRREGVERRNKWEEWGEGEEEGGGGNGWERRERTEINRHLQRHERRGRRRKWW